MCDNVRSVFLVVVVAAFTALACVHKGRLDGVLVTALGDFGKLGSVILEFGHAAVEVGLVFPNFGQGFGVAFVRTIDKTFGRQL